MKTAKKLALIAITVVLLTICFVFGVSALEPTGQCGENVYWNYNSATGELVISGTGPMKDYTDDTSPFMNSSIKNLVIEAGVTTIGEDAFLGCDSLTKVTMPYSIKIIENYAFYDCDGLTEIAIPYGVTDIRERAFQNCRKLKNITIGNSVKTISPNAFCNCRSLTSITVPNSVTVIGANAFDTCVSLSDITIPDIVAYIGTNAFDNTAYYNNNLNWKNGALYIGNHLIRAQENISGSYIIKDGTINIAYNAFNNCSKLTNITIADSVRTIGDYAFRGCDGITSITIPYGVTVLEQSVFSDCRNLTEITIPESVTTIDKYAIHNCIDLKDVYYEGSEEQWKKISIDYYNNSLSKATIHFNFHQHSYEKLTTHPTCTEQGYTTYTCSSCGDSYKDDYIDATGHTEVYITAVPATCTQEGLTEGKKCSVCDELLVAQAVIEKLPHTGVKATCTEGPVCELCKTTYGDPLGHDWIAPSCTEPKTCKSCGATDGSAYGHKWAFSETLMKPTCEDNGTDIYKCVDCGESYTETIPALGHDYVEGKVYASCDKDGYYYYECTMCGLSYNGDTIPATGHYYKERTEREPTCSLEGLRVRYCSACDFREEFPIEKTNHNYIEDRVLPTCEKDGYSTFTCVVCNSSYIDKIVAKFGHSFKLYVVDEGSATCYSDGTKTAICDHGCGKRNTVTDYGSKTDHDLVYFETICSPSCTDEGIEEARCINYDKCGYREECPIEPYGHDFEEIDVTEDGNTIYRCNNCKYIYTEFEDEAEHFYPAEWTTIIEPSCQEKGVAIRICYDCNSIESKYIPKSGHIDVDGDDKCDFCDKTIVIVEPNEEKPCSCDCHAGGIKAFFFKLINFFAKIFDKSARVCECGKSH